jgi:competence protein ComEC
MQPRQGVNQHKQPAAQATKRTAPNRVLHVSWHIASLSTGLLAGVVLSAIFDMSFTASAGWLLAAGGLITMGLSRRTASYTVFFLCAGLVLGLWRGSNEQLALQHYKPFFDKTVEVSGKVNEDTSVGDQGDVRLQLAGIRINGQHLHGKIWVSITPGKKAPVIKRSDTVQLAGKLDEGFGNLAASMSQARLTSLQSTSHNDAALRLRDWFANGIRQAIPEPQASLGSGFLTGQHSNLPSALSDELRVVGLTHAVVASGSNLTVLVGFTRRLFSRASKYTATMAGAFMTAGFIAITGMSPSMSRAGLVTGLSLAAWYYGRRIHPLVLLPFAAAITVSINPSYVWGDIGWYLSFTAFAGVLILAPLLQSYFWSKDYKPNIIMEIFIGTTAAQIATMPVILFSFGTYSSYALIANMLVLPLVPFAMLLTFVSGIAGVGLPALVHGAGWLPEILHVIGWPATIIMRYMTSVINWIATLPYAQGEITYGGAATAISYLFIILIIAYIWRKTGHNFRRGGTIVLGERP